MKTIKIYSLIDRDDLQARPMIFKGIESLREFALDRLDNGWDTDITEEELEDDDKLFNFLDKDYGCDIDIIAEVSINDFKIN